MLTLLNFSRTITDLKKEKKFSEALTYFKKNKKYFTPTEIANNEYIVSDMLTCLRNTNNIKAGFDFLKKFKIEIKKEQKEKILCAYGWLLWAKYKAENENKGQFTTEEEFFDEKDEIIETQNFESETSILLDKIETLIPFLNSDFTKTLSYNLFTIVLQSEKKKPSPNWKLVNEFCNKIDREKLSKECSTIKVEQKGQLKEMELASAFENWYAYKTNALTKLSEWQECFNLSKEALEKIENFHYSNDVWFARRVALSKKNLGDIEGAIKELKTILKKKQEWFIQKELAELYFEQKKIKSAFIQAIKAMNNFGQLEFKVDLLYLLGKILKQQDKLDLSFKHFSLSKLIRQSKEWKIPQKLFDELRFFPFPEIQQTDFQNLKNELQSYWDTSKTPQTQTFGNSETTTINYLEGEIVKILHDNERGKDCLIKCNGKMHYFSANSNYRSFSKIILGTKVQFEILPPKDGKKKRIKIKKIIE